MPGEEKGEGPPEKVPFGHLRNGVSYVAGAVVDAGPATVKVAKDVGVGTVAVAKWTGKKSVQVGKVAVNGAVSGAKVIGGAVADGAAVVAEDVGLGGLGDFLFGVEDVDDIELLPPPLRKVYKDPHKLFGLDKEETTTTMIRDAFRKQVLGFCTCFSGLPKSKHTVQQVLFAYHLLRKTVTGPTQKIMRTIRTNPYLTEFNPEDLLPLLRPLRGSYPCPPQYRGFRNLTVVYTSFSVIPVVSYTFTVHYCMRISTISKTYEECTALHNLLCGELLTIPDFPKNKYIDRIYFSYESRGEALATYFRKVHKKVSAANFFSPRLFDFLNIDFARIQNEEEGAIMAILDNPQPPPGTCWYMVDDAWLAKWRRFAMGRGPRRYLPPGRVTNGDLKTKAHAPGRKELKKGIDYRCVTFNVWRFLELVHGGGPIICREEQDIYSKMVFSYLQGVVWVQTHARMKMAADFRRRLYMERLSKGQVAKAVIYSVKEEQIKQEMAEMLERGDKERGDSKLVDAAILTRSMWRAKKTIIKEEQLERVKSDQEVFARARGANVDEPGEEGLVVRDIHPVIHIGSTNRYTVYLTEDEGFPRDKGKDQGGGFKIKRVPGTEAAVIGDDVNSLAFSRGSKIVSVNGYPASAMTFDMLKRRLGSGSFPYTIELERKLDEKSVPTLDDLWAIQEDNVQYSAFKLLLKYGMQVIRWDKGASYLTKIRVSETDFFYMSKFDVMKTEDEQWSNFCLLEIKFVQEAADVEITNSKKLQPKQEFFLNVVTDDVEVTFEIITDVDDLKEQTRLYNNQIEKALVNKSQTKTRKSGNCSNPVVLVFDVNSLSILGREDSLN